MAKEAVRKLLPLTSMRALAAGAIVAMHLGGHFGLPADMNHGERTPLYLGVSFFFVLSGFILTYVYPRFDGPGDYGRFLWARVARIWPCHLFAFLVAALVAAAFGARLDSAWRGPNLGPTLANLGMVHSWIPSSRFYMARNAPSWSISTEFGFYLVFPLLLWRLDRKWPLNLAVCLLPPAALMVYCSRVGTPYEAASGVTVNGLLYMNPISRVFEFALGMTAASLWRRVAPRMRIGMATGTVLELAAIGFLAASAYFWRDMAEWARTLLGASPACNIWFSHGLTCLGFAALIFVAALEAGWIARALSRPSLVFLGEISYAAYLLHWPLLGLAYAYLEPIRGLPNLVGLSIYVATVTAAAAFSWYVVEAPSRRFLLGLLPRRSATPAGRPAVATPAPHVRPAATRARAAGREG